MHSCSPNLMDIQIMLIISSDTPASIIFPYLPERGIILGSIMNSSALLTLMKMVLVAGMLAVNSGNALMRYAAMGVTTLMMPKHSRTVMIMERDGVERRDAIG